MFTGLVRTQGIVESLRRSPSPQLVVRSNTLRPKVGDSVAVDGVCLTVARRAAGRLTFDLLAETLRATTLGRCRPGDHVNLEPALRMGDPVGGHWVLGHVDGVGTVVRRAQGKAGLALTVAVPKRLRRYLAPKGAVTIDGVSLTIAPQRSRVGFTVFLIPHTARATTLGAKRPGDPVNLEADPIARYAAAAIDAVR